MIEDNSKKISLCKNLSKTVTNSDNSLIFLFFYVFYMLRFLFCTSFLWYFYSGGWWPSKISFFFIGSKRISDLWHQLRFVDKCGNLSFLACGCHVCRSLFSRSKIILNKSNYPYITLCSHSNVENSIIQKC